MATIFYKIKQLSKKNKFYFFFVALFSVFILIYSIKSAYAYYYTDSGSLNILTATVDDFDSGREGDINIMVYQQISGSNYYDRVASVPTTGYTLNQTKTSCKDPNGSSVTCTYNGSGNCYYSLSSGKISLTSNQKVTCKFYFNKSTSTVMSSPTPITSQIFIMKQDDINGTNNYNGKKYSQTDSVPAFGYEPTYTNGILSSYQCENGSELNYNPQTHDFSILSPEREVCYVYFDKVTNSDITVKTYVQSETDPTIYSLVDAIPINKVYKLSENESKKSVCYNNEGTPLNIVPTYENGYINVNGVNEKISCEVYLDIVSE